MTRLKTEHYSTWLSKRFPSAASKPLAPRHVRLWDWLDALEPRVKPKALIAVWARGGGKSMTAALGMVYVGSKLTRRFCLYVSGTQAQANRHVQTIASGFEKLGAGRLEGKYGASRGWRMDMIRTAAGFSVVAMGSDAAARGIKLDEFRPDIIVLDDIDSLADSPETIEKKIDILSKSILPIGSADCAVLGIQNLVHPDSIFSRLAGLSDYPADFLLDREVPPPEPAVIGLETELIPDENGRNVYRIVGGTATWEGQDLETCERQINEWGLRGFLEEAQHDVKHALGYFFDADKLTIWDGDPLTINFKSLCRAWDLAATEGGGDYTAGILMGLADDGLTYILDVKRGQWSSDKVFAMVEQTARDDAQGVINQRAFDGQGNLHIVREIGRFRGAVVLRLPQDPAQAGKYQAAEYRAKLAPYKPVILPVAGDKAIRAKGSAETVNMGNMRLLRGEWNQEYIVELRRFREDGTHRFDDQVDAGADAHTVIAKSQRAKKTMQTVRLW